MEYSADKPSATDRLWAVVEKYDRAHLHKQGWLDDAIEVEIKKRAAHRKA